MINLLGQAAEAHSFLDTRAGILALLLLSAMCAGGGLTVMLWKWVERKPAPNHVPLQRYQVLETEFRDYKTKAEEREARRSLLIADLLPTIGNLDRALCARNWPQNCKHIEPQMRGVEMVQQQLLTALERVGVTSFEPHLQPFDPHFHHAIAVVDEKTIDPGCVAEVHERGFMNGEKLLRPALVSVVRK